MLFLTGMLDAKHFQHHLHKLKVSINLKESRAAIFSKKAC